MNQKLQSTVLPKLKKKMLQMLQFAIEADLLAALFSFS